MGGGPFAITCCHVVDEFRKAVARDPRVTFQIGQYRLDPVTELVDSDRDLDLATFRLDPEKLEGRAVRGGAFAVHRAPQWPPREIVQGDVLSIGGYPGIWRQPTTANLKVDFDTFALGAVEVTSIQEKRIVCQFERDRWVQTYGSRGADLTKMGGISGAPALVLRQLHWELAGVVTDHSEEFDLLYVTLASRVSMDGKLLP